MIIKKCSPVIGFIVLISICAFGQPSLPTPYGPVPSANQLGWQQMEYYAFVHLSVNTYTDMAWGNGNEDPAMFNPVQLDCRKWARLFKDAGMKGVILTAKHHSGFCLWPSKFTDYSVKKSPWKNGQGDIVKEMSAACKEIGLKFGIYLSPWDRNRADYGAPSYIDYFRNQLRELLTNYGDIFEIWFDGANGGSGYYGGANETRKIDRNTYYDWENTYKLVRELQPKIVIWNDGGRRADLRWVGTEAGYVGETNWSLLDSTGEVLEDMLRHGVEDGNAWVPGEVNTSIRPEWFYHKKEDTKVKSPATLMEIFYNSVGRNASLLLNFPIMPNGLIHPSDQRSVLELAASVKKAFANNLTRGAKATSTKIRGNDARFGPDKVIDNNNDTYWATDDSIRTAGLTIDFGKIVSFNRFLVQEYIPLGQRVKSFTVEAFVNGNWLEIAKQTTIGYKRILRFGTVAATAVRLTITDSKACPLIANIEVYAAPLMLEAPRVIRTKSGNVIVRPADTESQVFYTVDGTTPSKKSRQYLHPVKTKEGKLRFRCIAYDPRSKKYSDLAEETFDESRKRWNIIGLSDSSANKILDGDPDTEWYQPNNVVFPADLIIDLGKTENIVGIQYLPDQHWWASGIIAAYSFFVSPDASKWTQVSTGEFANINNNPLLQTRKFKLARGRYIKFRALRNTKYDNKVGYAEFAIITH